MKKLLLILSMLLLVSGLALAQGTYYVDYFTNNAGPVSGAPDQIIRIINGGSGGYMGANIYVFTADQELIACRSELLSPDGLDSAYVGRLLTSNPVTSVVPTSGVVKIVTRVTRRRLQSERYHQYP